jgi:putative oxygen-independent coproporphyrinogen III oxidase
VRHLYCHVPFCARRCSYCDFSIAVRSRIPAREFVAAIRTELTALGPIGPLETIYLGGGTPSLLPPDALAALLLAVTSSTPLLDGVEITLEANPEDVTASAVRSWREAGVNRVSLGVQSFDDRVLSWMHRVHDAAQARRAIDVLRDGGVATLSLDLIFAVPTELGRDWERDLDRAIAAAPDHLSLYGLTVEPRTPFARWVDRGSIGTASDERYAEEYHRAHVRLAAAGYTFYEVSNAARPGRRARHNSAYWSGAAYVGLGPAAHSFDGRSRRWNRPAWEHYRRAMVEGRSPVETEESLTDAQRGLERVYLGLRTIEGIPASVLSESLPSLRALRAQGWLLDVGDRVRCSIEGWLRLDALVAALTERAAVS